MIYVCKTFFCKLFGIGKRRIETVQQKLLFNSTLHDNRGKHKNHAVKLNDNVKTLIHLHAKSIPHSQSHYTREDSSLNYFNSPDLNFTKLYNLFLDYYTSVTGDQEIPL